MATHPIKSMFGKLVGLTRPTTTYTTERLFAKGGFIGPAIYLSTAEGSETAVNIQGFTDVETGSTAVAAALATRGITQLTSAATTGFTLAAPSAAGIRKTFVTITPSTLLRQVVSAAQIIAGNSSTAACGADGGSITASTAMTVLSFNGLGQCIELLSLSTSAWLNTGLRGYNSTQAAPLSS
jgi:hypothetical protein